MKNLEINALCLIPSAFNYFNRNTLNKIKNCIYLQKINF